MEQESHLNTVSPHRSEAELLARFARYAPVEHDLSRRLLRSSVDTLLGALPRSLGDPLRSELPPELSEGLADLDAAQGVTLTSSMERGVLSRDIVVRNVAQVIGACGAKGQLKGERDEARAFELAQVSFGVLGETLSAETRERLARALPEELAGWLILPERAAEAPIRMSHGKTLADGNFGGGRTLAEGSTESESSLAAGKPGSSRPLGEQKR